MFPALKAVKPDVPEAEPESSGIDLKAFRQMVDQMPINVMTCDLETFKIDYANKSTFDTVRELENVLPIKADGLLGTCIDIFHKDPGHQRRLLANPANLPHHAQIEVAGEILDLLISAITDSDGTYIAPMLTWSVVTEKVRGEKQTAQLVATLDGIGASQAMIEFEMDGTIITANENFLAALGYQLSEIEGKHHSIFVDPAYKESAEYRQFWDALRAGKFQSGEMMRLHKGGKEVWIQAAYNPVLDADGKPYKVVKNAVDITDKKIAALANEAESKRLLNMIDEMPINIMTCDPEDFTLNYINKTSFATLRTVEHLLPCRADDLLGKCIDIFHKNPAHQRQILGDPANLPHNAKIALGDETLDLNVSAIRDEDGTYLGPMVSWAVVTEQVKLADDFENNVKAVVDGVSASATEMQATAQGMSSTAEETNRQSSAVAAAAEQATTNVQTVASAAEQLSASVNEISGQVTKQTKIAENAVEEAQQTNAQIQELATAAQKIDEVVKLISDIAGQTNLLALNATIEAARAGDAGRGFAVVASEVKSLANQTAKATEEIAAQIAAVQSATTNSVSAIDSISKVIGEISEISTSVASAVEEQSAATQEIARNVQEAATGTKEVTENIIGVTKAATETGASATEVLEAAGELSKQSESLAGQVDNFLVQVRAM